MQSFLKLLRGSGVASPPLEELVTLAGRLCRDLQNDPSQVQPLVSAMLDNQQRLGLLNNKDVVMVCARVLYQLEQHQAACKLLEGCWVSGDTQQLVKLWNDIHYHLVMKRRGLPRLTARQKFLCRVRNPPPFSLCPDALKNRRYPREVRWKLEDFASSVSKNPSLAQMEILAVETNLTAEQVFNWFLNYRRKWRTGMQRINEAQEAAQYPRHPAHHCHPGFGPVHQPQWSGGEENRPAQSLETTQEPWEPLDPLCDHSRDKRMPKPQTPREVSSPTGQLDDSHGLDLTVCPAYASVAMSLATSAEPSPRGLGCTASDPDSFRSASGSGLSYSSGFTDPPNCAPQSIYVEEGLGASISQEGQAGSFLVTQSPPPAPESRLPERFRETTVPQPASPKKEKVVFFQIKPVLLGSDAVCLETLELVELWNDIHYHLVLKRGGLGTRTPSQMVYYRERNYLPASLCPDVPKNRYYPREVRQKLEDFALNVSNKPSNAEREILAAQTSLTIKQVSKWFSNYRLCKRHCLCCKRPGVQLIKQAQDTPEYLQDPAQHDHQGSGHVHQPQWSGGEENRPAKCRVTTHGPSEPLDLASDFCGDKNMPQPETPREVSSPTGQLVHSHELDLTVWPADSSVAMSVATSAEPSPRGLGCTASDPDPIWPASGSGLSFSARFTDPPNCAPRSTYLQEGQGASISQEGQVGSFLVTQSRPPAPESHLPERNPPPPFLLPDGVKIRLFSREVRRKLYDFASSVTSHPNKAEREILATQTNLTSKQVSKWFNNYRLCMRRRLRCKRPCVQHIQQARDKPKYPQDPAQDNHHGCGHVHQSQWSGGEENRPAQSLVTTQGPSEPLDPACDLSRDKKRTKPQKPSLTQLAPAGPGPVVNLSEPSPSSQVKWSKSQVSSDTFWVARALLELSTGNQG